MFLFATKNKEYNPLDDLMDKRFKYIYNICRLYYSANDKQSKYCITNIYSVVGHINKSGSGKYPLASSIYLALVGNDEDELRKMILDFKDLLDYNNVNFSHELYNDDMSDIINLIEDITKFVADGLAYEGRLAFNSFRYYIRDLINKYKSIDGKKS